MIDENTKPIDDSDLTDGGKPPTYIVGIGASAGGLESLEKLFRSMPTKSAMAYVVLQHLSPDFKSMMSELLARDTSMRIIVAEDGIRVEANVIYLLPPKKQMILADGCLHLSEKDVSRGLNLPIDHFLVSLAREMGEYAIALILSGSGTDGTKGAQEISRHGGLVISESLDTAKFDGMPASAQASGTVDLVLSPPDMGDALLRYCEDPDTFPSVRQDRIESDSPLKGIDSIIQTFRKVYDIDFSSYKDTTVKRRIQRRLDMAHVNNFDQYAEVLQKNPEELHRLYSDLLIGVTQFFRDPEIFDYVTREILPGVLKRRKKNEPIRVWVAGCATGEEAYSVAIALQEAMLCTEEPRPLKLFATDVHKRSIEHASRGIFRDDVLKGVTPELLERYFTRRTDGFQIRSEIRQMIVFAPHNVLRDAPFTDLDFVSCRNLLIYFRPSAQRRAISLFHYGLRLEGILLLGGSESTGELANEFDTISERYRIYRKRRDVRLTHNLRSPLTSADSVHRGLLTHPLPVTGVNRTRQLHDELLDLYMPPSILIDTSRSVIDTFSGAEKLLRFPSRKPSLDVLDLVDREIRTTLSGAIGRAIKNQAEVRFGKLAIQNEDETKLFNMTVRPLAGKAEDIYYLITFEPVTNASSEQVGSNLQADLPSKASSLSNAGIESLLDASRTQIRQLEDDLRYSRENLQATVEELETSNEELQATNEELIASNEELQSTNEELHSLNEELYSVNSEHQLKIEELAELNRDMNHLLENTDVATVFLDSDLKIRRFTSRVREVFELIDEDIGRSIHVFGSKLRIDDLVQRLKDVLQKGEAYEREVRGADGTSYLMRLLPYRPDDLVSGVVMMWVDVSSLEMLRGRLRWLSAIVESTNDAIIGQDLSGIITSWNRGAEQLYGYTAAEILGKKIDILIPTDRAYEVAEYRDRILRGETILTVDTVRLGRDRNPIDVSLTVSPVFNSENQVIGISKIARDIGERIRMEQEIRNQVRRRERFLAMLSHELRNPLNVISNATAILSNENADEQTKVSTIVTMKRQIRMITHLLADLLDVARIAEDRISLEFQPLDLRDLVPAVKEVVQSELERHNCAVEFEFPDHAILVNGDPTRLIQIQVNLIHNAAKYSGTTEAIRVKMDTDESTVSLSVIDQGRGIPKESLETIFEPFAQLDYSSSMSDGGLGVGLTLAKSLVELHGGSIHAISKGEWQGSSFHISLPKFDLEEDTLPGFPLNPEQEQSVALPATKLTICVVEDIEANRDMMKTLLELDGHLVSTVNDGISGIDVLTNQRFDLAFVDIGLPDISGYEVATRVREKFASEQLKLIALTGYGQPRDIQDAIDAGFDDHFLKPIDPEKLTRLCASHNRRNSGTNPEA